MVQTRTNSQTSLKTTPCNIIHNTLHDNTILPQLGKHYEADLFRANDIIMQIFYKAQKILNKQKIQVLNLHMMHFVTLK